MARLPRCNDPSVAIDRLARDVWRNHHFITVRLSLESSRAFEHHTILHPQVSQFFARSIGKPHFHQDTFLQRLDLRAKPNPVGKLATHLQYPRTLPGPLKWLEHDPLLRPECGYMRVGQIGEPMV